jgi:hypothetical protein
VVHIIHILHVGVLFIFNLTTNHNYILLVKMDNLKLYFLFTLQSLQELQFTTYGFCHFTPYVFQQLFTLPQFQSVLPYGFNTFQCMSVMVQLYSSAIFYDFQNHFYQNG